MTACIRNLLTLFSLSFSGNKMKNKTYHNIGTILKPSWNITTTPLSEQFQSPIHLFTFVSTISKQHPEQMFFVLWYFTEWSHKTSLTPLHKTSLAPPLLWKRIYQAREESDHVNRGIDFASFYYFQVEFLNYI
jgi:hypothetical protein